MTLYTVGHGARPLKDFIDILREARVRRLVDVRRFPVSRRHPHFSRQALKYALLAAGIVYEWWGENLGGRRTPRSTSRHTGWQNKAFRGYADHMETPVFRSTLARLEDVLRRGPNVAMMCAETLWWQCHRRLIADALTVRGFEVVHLMDVGIQKPHSLTDTLRVTKAGEMIYDRVPATADLYVDENT